MATHFAYGFDQTENCYEDGNINLDFLNTNGLSKIASPGQSASELVDSITQDLKRGQVKVKVSDTKPVSTDQLLTNLRRRKQRSKRAAKAQMKQEEEELSLVLTEKKEAKSERSRKKKATQCGTKRRRKTSE